MTNTDGSQRALTPTSVNLTPTTALDLSFLPEEQRKVLLADYHKGILDVAKEAHRMHLDVAILEKTLATLSSTVQDVAQSGNAATISHVHNTKTGRTEVLVGNTERAFGGKLTASQTGTTNWTPAYVIAGLVALVLIVAAVFGHH
ncbi:MAG TPA: hypothetical protein VGL35_09455 [Rhizomicrobium sp.]|jgi:hypothetical protein